MENSKTKLCICGIGPGNPEYILPVVYSKVKEADVLIGGKRQLSIFSEYQKISCLFTGKLAQLKKTIEENKGNKILVLVSGDTGFYSLRRFITQEYSQCKIDIVPGISSFQYLYAKLGLGYENAFLASVHGKEVDFVEKIKHHSSVFLLTDKKNNWKEIANKLVKNDLGNLKMHVGDKLSYPDETILSGFAHELCELNEDFELCSVIIENQSNQ